MNNRNLGLNQKQDYCYLWNLWEEFPFAAAEIKGSAAFPEIRGKVTLYETGEGILLEAEIQGLPQQKGACGNFGVFGFHIHAGDSCSGNDQDPFADTGGHYNPMNCPHPYHAGDLPPLFSNEGRAWMAFLTERFTLDEVIGRTVVIHNHPDDFTTQPAGNSGTKIACGVIRAVAVPLKKN